MATTETVTIMPAAWRFKVGAALIAWTILSWLLLPIEGLLGMSASTIAATTAVLAVGNKLVLLLAIAVMGKAGFQELRAKIFHQITPPVEVSPLRYRIGLVMFWFPFLHNTVETWGSHITPQFMPNRVWVDIFMDGMMIASLLVLGGNFWDKLRALFFVEARAVFPEKPATTATASPVR